VQSLHLQKQISQLGVISVITFLANENLLLLLVHYHTDSTLETSLWDLTLIAEQMKETFHVFGLNYIQGNIDRP